MRLIDTTPFDIKLMDIPDGTEDYKQGYIDGARHVLEEMDEAPTVDAVPLDKVCKMLGTNSACPQNNNHEYCLTARCELCWKDYLTKWMEEQNN